ncbi:uroporphyrinogen-III C-methyltransferase [Halioxenophilus sp. WMMB6]|uniref:uroporphyrinogen-III C-methyltransferase n=1 Tax=Halioxenophilus sp. WMMB6 TaxID=3073815 RepID=UPI00295F3A48|nr:uroporphyrinogen-III C-methyltransferase [Halioxenophilus sp. WMMB6]
MSDSNNKKEEAAAQPELNSQASDTPSEQSAATAASSTSTAETAQAKAEPAKPKAEPSKAKAESSKPKAEPAKPKAESSTPKAEPANLKAEQAAARSVIVSRSRPLWFLASGAGVISLLAVALVVAAFWWQRQQWQALAANVAQSEVQLTEARAARQGLAVELQSAQAALAEVQTAAGQESSKLEDDLRAVTERLDAHNQRLLSLSNTSREDWQLAEAHYLLHLANQRLLVDRQASSALGLMEATDNILRDLALPDLFPVRQALAHDLAAVRLAAKVDKEGIYLRLQGLIDNMEQLPLYQIPELDAEPVVLSSSSEAPAAETATGVWSWFKSLPGKAWSGIKALPGMLGAKLNSYIVIRTHVQDAAPLLPPSSEEYLRQNVRLSLEQAQVAMLREQQSIYQASLEQALLLVQRYFPESPANQALQTELSQLRQMPIAVTLPQITGSLQQLQAYIERLHQLKGSEQESAE